MAKCKNTILQQGSVSPPKPPNSPPQSFGGGKKVPPPKFSKFGGGTTKKNFLKICKKRVLVNPLSSVWFFNISFSPASLQNKNLPFFLKIFDLPKNWKKYFEKFYFENSIMIKVPPTRQIGAGDRETEPCSRNWNHVCVKNRQFCSGKTCFWLGHWKNAPH